MKHKKQNSDKKRFWLGMAGCALVSFTAYAVSYFSSSHIFSNEYNANKNYSVEIYDVIDTSTSTKSWQNRDTTINADFVIKNTGEIPVLLRLKYKYGYRDKETLQWYFYSDVKQSYRNSLDKMIDWFSGVVQNEDKFLFNGETVWGRTDSNPESDGYYYYKGVLKPNETIQHLDAINIRGRDEQIGKNSRWYYQGLDSNNKENWEGSNLGIGKMLWSGNGSATFKYGISGYKGSKQKSLRATAETIQAPIKDDGSYLSDDDVKDLDVLGMKKYWTDALGDN